MADVRYTVSGDGSVVQAQDKISEAVKRTGENTKQTAEEAKKFDRLAQKIAKDNETAWERFNRKLHEAEMATKGLVNGEELLRRQSQRLLVEYEKTTQEFKDREAAQKRATESELENTKRLEQQAIVSETRRERAYRKRIDAELGAIDVRRRGATAAEQAEAAFEAKSRINLQHLTASSKEAGLLGNALSTAFSVQSLLAYGASLISIHQAFRLVTEELRMQQEIVDKGTRAKLTVEESRKVLLRNLVGESPETIQGVLGQSTDIATRTGVSEVAINQALASAISATGGNVGLSTNLVGLAAQFLVDQPGQIGEFAGTLGDLTRVTGSQDPLVQLGLLSQLGKLSRITDPSRQAKNIAPALIGTMDFGGNARESGALFTALTTGSGDVTGERTRTATIQLAKQLDDLVKGNKQFAEMDPELQAAAAGGAGLSIGGRVQMLQQNAALREAFLGKASFEAVALGPIRQLLKDPNSAIAADYRNALGSIGNDAGLRATGQQALRTIGMSPTSAVSDLDRALSTGAELLQSRNATRFLSTDQVSKLADTLNELAPNRAGMAMAFDLSLAKAGDRKLSIDEAIGILKPYTEINEMRRNADMMRGMSAEESERAQGVDVAKKQLEALLALKQTSEETRDEMKKINQNEGGLVAVPE